MLGEVVFAPPAIFEAKAFLVGIGADLLVNSGLRVNRNDPLANSTIGPNPKALASASSRCL